MAINALTAWFVTDGKPGHRNQLEGLKQALAAYTDLQEHWFQAGGALNNMRLAMTTEAQRAPHLIIACGHRTHLLALALKRRFGGRLIVLMRPSLPLGWFDLCVLPEHDRAPQADNILRTRGVLNTIIPASTQSPDTGLILIGGPSKHHTWDSPAMAAQLQRLKGALPGVAWTLTDSRRTPAEFAATLAPLVDTRFSYIPAAQTPRGWLGQQMRQRGRIWVSEDSVSMVYESLSSGARVGLLEVPRRGPSRVSAGVDRLLANRHLTTLDHLEERGDMLPAQPPLREADRVAKYIIDREARLA